MEQKMSGVEKAKWIALLVGTVVFMLLVLWVVVSHAQSVGVLVNPGFEPPYTERGAPERKVAVGWNLWFANEWNRIPGITDNSFPTGIPEFKGAIEFPYRIRSGTGSQCWFNTYRSHYAGVYQVVRVVKGKTYVFTVWAQSWANISGDVTKSDGYYISLGIDPDGGEWFDSRAIQWSQWNEVPGAGSTVMPQWKQFTSPPVEARSDTISVWMSGANRWARLHGDIYVDDAKLEEIVESTTPCPTPVVCPTSTPSVGCPVVPGWMCEVVCRKGL